MGRVIVNMPLERCHGCNHTWSATTHNKSTLELWLCCGRISRNIKSHLLTCRRLKEDSRSMSGDSSYRWTWWSWSMLILRDFDEKDWLNHSHKRPYGLCIPQKAFTHAILGFDPNFDLWEKPFFQKAFTEFYNLTFWVCCKLAASPIISKHDLCVCVFAFSQPYCKKHLHDACWSMRVQLVDALLTCHTAAMSHLLQPSFDKETAEIGRCFHDLCITRDHAAQELPWSCCMDGFTGPTPTGSSGIS